MYYPDWHMAQTIVEMRRAEARAASNGLPRQARPISSGRLRLLSGLSRGLLSIGGRMTDAGLALRVPDVRRSSL